MIHAELCRASQFRKTFDEKFKNIVVKIISTILQVFNI